MNKLIYFLTGLVLVSCSPDRGEHRADEKFNYYKEGFIEAFWEVHPGYASGQGYHNYDSILAVPDEAYRSRLISFATAHLDSLKQLDVTKLSSNNKTDYYMIKNRLEDELWSIREERSHEWNPARYNVSGDFAEMLNNDYDTLETRLQNFYKRMDYVKGYYDAAKKNIRNPTREHTQLAIEQNLGGLSVFEVDLKQAVEQSTLNDEQKQQVLSRSSEVVDAIKNYVEWLKALSNESPRDFRLGKALYAKKFDYDIQSRYSVEEIFQKAVSHKKSLHQKMAVLAEELWPAYMKNAPKPSDTLQMIRQVIDKISLNHVHPDSFQVAIEKQIPELTAFVREKNLLYLDPNKPLVVRKEPDYMAGVAGASISAPGPYDKEGNTYYNVGSLSGWSEEQAESYLREYNHYTLQILNIHEAIPGHYAQLVYSNQSPSIIKSVFGNGAMIEGWAVYTELMMLENGYGNDSPELWLMYYKWNLRSTCNTILDIGVHVNEMTKDEAMDLLVNQAFQQQAEAEGKWRRVTLTSVQLCSYFTGFQEIYDLREELKTKMGDQFNLKSFHEKFLSYGSAPVKYIREMMLADIE